MIQSRKKRRLAMRLSEKEFKKKLEKQREKVNQKKFEEVLHELDRPVRINIHIDTAYKLTDKILRKFQRDIRIAAEKQLRKGK